jgi:uncharacterized protein
MDLKKALKRLCYLQTLLNSQKYTGILADYRLADISKEVSTLEKLIASIDADNADRQGCWFFLASGNRFWLFDPRPEDVHIEDIAHGLSNICRFSGQSRKFFSVAQHSVLVSEQLTKPYQLAGLLHDAAEAYVGDIITPVKHAIKGFDKIEAKIMGAIRTRFGLDEGRSFWNEVKKADDMIMATEFRDVARHGIRQGGFPYPPLKAKIRAFWEPASAKARFLERFEQLCPKLVQMSLGLNQPMVVAT